MRLHYFFLLFSFAFTPVIPYTLSAQSIAYTLDSLTRMPAEQFAHWLTDQPDTLAKPDVALVYSAVYNRLKNQEDYSMGIQKLEEQNRMADLIKATPYTLADRRLSIEWMNIKSIYLDYDSIAHDSILLKTRLKLHVQVEKESTRLLKLQYQAYIDLGNIFLNVYRDSARAEACFAKGRYASSYKHENTGDKKYFRNIRLQALVGQIKCRKGSPVGLRELYYFPTGFPEILSIYESYMKALLGEWYKGEDYRPEDPDGYVKYTPPSAAAQMPPQITRASNANAHDGSIAVSVAGGGMAPYSFHWDVGTENSNELSNLGPGTYCVTITDVMKCCSMLQCLKVGIRDPSLIAGLQYRQICSGDDGSLQVVLAHDGTPPYFFQWDNGDTTQYIHQLSPGQYCVKVGDQSGHFATMCFTIKDRISIFGNVTHVYTGSMPGAIELSASGGQSPYYYVWSNGATTQDVTNLPAGNYCVTVTDQTGCTNIQCFTIQLLDFSAFALDSTADKSVLLATYAALNSPVEAEIMQLQKIQYQNYLDIANLYLHVYKDKLQAEAYFIKGKNYPFYLKTNEADHQYFKYLYVFSVDGQMACNSQNYLRLKELQSGLVPAAWPEIAPYYDSYISSAGGKCDFCGYTGDHPIRFMYATPIQDIEQLQIIKH